MLVNMMAVVVALVAVCVVIVWLLKAAHHARHSAPSDVDTAEELLSATSSDSAMPAAHVPTKHLVRRGLLHADVRPRTESGLKHRRSYILSHITAFVGDGPHVSPRELHVGTASASAPSVGPHPGSRQVRLNLRVNLGKKVTGSLEFGARPRSGSNDGVATTACRPTFLLRSSAAASRHPTPKSLRGSLFVAENDESGSEEAKPQSEEGEGVALVADGTGTSAADTSSAPEHGATSPRAASMGLTAASLPHIAAEHSEGGHPGSLSGGEAEGDEGDDAPESRSSGAAHDGYNALESSGELQAKMQDFSSGVAVPVGEDQQLKGTLSQEGASGEREVEMTGGESGYERDDGMSGGGTAEHVERWCDGGGRAIGSPSRAASSSGVGSENADVDGAEVGPSRRQSEPLMHSDEFLPPLTSPSSDLIGLRKKRSRGQKKSLEVYQQNVLAAYSTRFDDVEKRQRWVSMSQVHDSSDGLSSSGGSERNGREHRSHLHRSGVGRSDSEGYIEAEVISDDDGESEEVSLKPSGKSTSRQNVLLGIAKQHRPSSVMRKRNSYRNCFLRGDSQGEGFESADDDLVTIKDHYSGSLGRSEDATGDDDDILGDSDLHDWNERFQRIMRMIHEFDANTPVTLQVRAKRALIQLARDFIYASSTYGKIIISEAYSEEKTIKPLPLGGMMGGQKYIVQNILFKFAVDENHFYKSDYAAAKVAGHELKGVINYFNCGFKDLCLPLMSLVDYRGFRLIAMSILPIRGRLSLCYGSDDYGHNVHKDDMMLNNIMERTARILNIKEHFCGMDHKTSRSLCAPADLEGHLGDDGRFYLLDFSRVFPPETPAKHLPNAHLYNLLRPEFVKSYPEPLCSDAFSGFIAKHNYKEDNAEVVRATNHLLNVVIPEFAVSLSGMMEEVLEKGYDTFRQFRLTEAMHRRGINMRYLGAIRKHISQLDCRTFLLVEMCARVIKNKLRKLLRDRMKQLKVPLEDPYRRLVVEYLNIVLGTSEMSEDYWDSVVKPALELKFVDALTGVESTAAYALKSSISDFESDSMDGRMLLFMRIQKMTGLQFTKRINQEFLDNPNNWGSRGEFPLHETDLEGIGLRVKHMNIVSQAEGYVLHQKGNQMWSHDPVAAQRFFDMAVEKYEEALDTNPNDVHALCHCAEISQRQIEGASRAVSEIRYNWADPAVQHVNLLFQRALHADSSDSYTLYRYAQFLEKCTMEEEAEEMFLRSLEADPNNALCLQEYGEFLMARGQHQEGERFLQRASVISQKYIQ